jgi:SAM-dependent methyltransferase
MPDEERASGVAGMARAVDYDRVAATYDERYVVYPNRGVGRALRGLARRLRPERALEVGCGTGRWLAELEGEIPQLVGLDPSTGMLGRAARRAHVPLIAGRANGLPFARPVFDLILCVNALHHFEDPRAFVSEAAGLLRPGGALALVGLDAHVVRKRWWVYQYFEGAHEADQRRFPRWPEVLDWMSASGLTGHRCRAVEHFSDAQKGRAFLEDPFLKRESTSQLLLLSDLAYAAGLERVRAAITNAEDQGREMAFAVDIDLVMAVGRRPRRPARPRRRGPSRMRTALPRR